MLRLRDLPSSAVQAGMRHGRFRLFIGDLSVRIDSSIPELAEGLGKLYGYYPVSLEGGAYDYDLSLNPASWWRRWVRRNAVFGLSGQAPFLPMAPSHAHALFEWGLNWTIGSLAHQYLILHSGVVEKQGRAVLLAAVSGSGKSTLTAELVMRDWRLFSDELALIDGDRGCLVPMPRPVSLKNQSIDVIRRRHPAGVFGPVAEDTHKGTIAHLVAPDASVDLASVVAPPALIVFPKWRQGAALTVVPVGQGQAAMRLIDQSFNYPILGARGFDWLSSLVRSAEAWEIEYSDLDEVAGALDELIAS